MKNTIMVAGATGNLGEKIYRELIKQGAGVKAIVRPNSDAAKVDALQKQGIEVVKVDFTDTARLIAACRGVDCVVSALAGLREVIVTAQSQLLHAAVQAGVPRFIPSDFCTDYRQLPEGANRNFDLRREFQTLIDGQPIQATSILNGAFAYVLQYGIPLFDPKSKTIAYYDGKEDWQIDFTSLDDTAAYTAAAALDDTAPRYLRIAGFRVSPQELVPLSEKLYGQPFELTHSGTMEQFADFIKSMRAQHPEGENELYPAWQQMQYLYSMFAAHHNALDNERYPNLRWTSAAEALRQKQA